jgi:hypothetical protein
MTARPAPPRDAVSEQDARARLVYAMTVAGLNSGPIVEFVASCDAYGLDSVRRYVAGVLRSRIATAADALRAIE